MRDAGQSRASLMRRIIGNRVYHVQFVLSTLQQMVCEIYSAVGNWYPRAHTGVRRTNASPSSSSFELRYAYTLAWFNADGNFVFAFCLIVFCLEFVLYRYVTICS